MSGLPGRLAGALADAQEIRQQVHVAQVRLRRIDDVGIRPDIRSVLASLDEGLAALTRAREAAGHLHQMLIEARP